VAKEGGSIIHKSGDRIVHLLGQNHIIKGGHLECQQCKMTAGSIEAFSTLCRQGTCKGSLLKGMHVSAGIVEGNASRPDHLPGKDSQRQEGKNFKNYKQILKRRRRKTKNHTS